MDVVVDTVSCHHLVRCPQRRGKKRETAIDTAIAQKRLRLAFDQAGGILDEWRRTIGVEIVGVLLSKWEISDGIIFVRNPGTVRRDIMRKLRQLGLIDTVDKLVLRVALRVDGRRIVSDDPDFWNPIDPDSRGNLNAPIAKICREELSTRVMLLKDLLQELRT